MKKKKILTTIWCALFLTFGITFGQLSITTTGANFTINFDDTISGVNNGSIDGTGFATTPIVGNLDGDAWEVTGFSNENQAYGANSAFGDMARGTSTGGVGTGGLYAFDISNAGTVNRALGVQPIGADFTPGTITLKITNNSGTTVTSVAVNYKVYIYNDQNRGNNFNFSHSSDDATYTTVSNLNLVSVATADSLPKWIQNNRGTTISGLTLVDGATFYLRWTGNDIDGSNSRDEFSLDDITVKMFSNTWDGSSNSVWTTGTNWQTGAAPGISDDIVIPAGLTNYPTASAATTINSVTINSGATLKAEDNFTGTVTYKRNLATTNWYMLSSPVSGETIQNIIANHTLASGTGSTLGFAFYDNSETLATDRWNYQLGSSTGALANGKGYSVKLSATNNISFSGTINTADVSIALTQGAGNNFNLIGNPFTTFINSGTFLTEEGITTSDITSATLWLWNQGSGAYETKVAGDSFKIAPGQGFFVEANSTNNVIFTEAMQSHEAADTFQRSSNSRSEIKLYMNNENNSRFLKIYYVDGATTGFDNGYDGELFGGISNPLAIYSHLVSSSQGKKYQIQSLPNSNYENMVVPIGVAATSGQEITFSTEALNLPTNLKVFIEDRATNTFTRLDEANSVYKVTLTETLKGIGRFYIHTAQNVLSAKYVNLENISIYKSDSSTLKIVDLQQGATTITLFNILGKQMMKTSFIAKRVEEISLPKLAKGVYIVQLKTETGKLNKKIILE